MTSSRYACKCLNVRIRSTQAPGSAADIPGNDDADFTPVYTGDEGIEVMHPQLTLRTHSRGVPIGETPRCSRYTTLSCLMCQTTVYRVNQITHKDVEGKEGPQLPTDDWVEEEILKSATGRVEVHRGCLIDDAVTNAEISPSYSPVFSLVLDTPLSTSSPPGVPPPPHTPSSRSTLPSGSILPIFRPLFPPAPFTPSHPVFLHLSTIASKHSESVRVAHEEYLAKAAREKAEEIERSDAKLRREVEVLWRRFRQNVDRIEQERAPRVRSSSRPKDSSDIWPGASSNIAATGSSRSYGTPVLSRDFVPALSPQTRDTATAALPRLSSLSASLAHTSFHHPVSLSNRSSQSHATAGRVSRPPPPYSSKPSSPASVTSLSISSHSSGSFRNEGENDRSLEPFRRSMDQSKDIAASYRYFSNVEAEMARMMDTNRPDSDAQINQAAGNNVSNSGNLGTQAPTTVAEPPANRHTSPQIQDSASTSRSQVGRSSSHSPKDIGSEPSSDREKGKRKVTFDIMPAVVTIKRDISAEKDGEGARRSESDAEEMIFDLDDEGSERSLSSAPKPVLQLLEHSQTSNRRAHGRTPSATSLPESFLALRPTSLPVPTNVRLPRTTDSNSPRPAHNGSQGVSSADVKRPYSSSLETESSFNAREAEILKLVAADTPSHRGAWKKDSKAWQMFVRRQGGKATYPRRGIITEETEDDDDTIKQNLRLPNDDDTDDDDDSTFENDIAWSRHQPPLASSLPIAIHPLIPTIEPLSLSSYQPKTTLSEDRESGRPLPDQEANTTSWSLSSASARRRAAYAERDRTRSMDPGALDFAGESYDDDDDSSEEGIAGDATEAGERGRQRALKILQKRSELPAAGMWRSLA